MLLCRGLRSLSAPTLHAPDYDFMTPRHPNSGFLFSSLVLRSFLQSLHLQHVVAIQEACG